MGAEALEKVSLYWLCHLPEAGACRYVGSESWQAVSEKLLYRRNTILEKRNF